MYTLTKRGTFTLKFAKGNQCGPEKGSSEFSYEFEVGTTELNSRGFVVEHVEASAAIEEWAASQKFAGSCENVVEAIIRTLLPHIAELSENSRLRVAVTRTGNATITWKTFLYVARSRFGAV